MPRQHKQISVSGTVTSVFARRFVVEGKGGKHLADIGKNAVDLVDLHEGDKVKLKGRAKSSQIKVDEIAKGRGETIHIERHPKTITISIITTSITPPRSARRDCCVEHESFTVLGAPLEKRNHFDILGRASNGAYTEFHVEPKGSIRKRKTIDISDPNGRPRFPKPEGAACADTARCSFNQRIHPFNGHTEDKMRKFLIIGAASMLLTGVANIQLATAETRDSSATAQSEQRSVRRQSDRQ